MGAACRTDLSMERRMVVTYALALVDKVDYFWGGKSLVLGWDDRWGEPAEVTAEGSDSTGTERLTAWTAPASWIGVLQRQRRQLHHRAVRRGGAAR